MAFTVEQVRSTVAPMLEIAKALAGLTKTTLDDTVVAGIEIGLKNDALMAFFVLVANKLVERYGDGTPVGEAEVAEAVKAALAEVAS